MTHSPVLIVHVCAGIISVLSGSAAMIVSKGSRLHRTCGDLFVLSLLSMAISGAYLAFTKSELPDGFAGLLTFYLVATVWSSVY